VKITISVKGIPPKKDGANSMWNKTSELPRLKALRLAVYQAAAGHPLPQGDVHLTLRVWAPASAGDLDNFITGICDGLMAAHRGTPPNSTAWLDVPPEVHPSRPILLTDDKVISRIEAERLAPGGLDWHYEVTVEWCPD
jgi:hypothetical protein